MHPSSSRSAYIPMCSRGAILKCNKLLQSVNIPYIKCYTIQEHEIFFRINHRKEGKFMSWKKRITFCTMLFMLISILVCFVGCTSNTPSKSETFKNYYKEISPTKIALNFAWKDDVLHEADTFSPYLTVVSKWGSAPIQNVQCSAVGGKLGLIVETAGNTWSVGDLYNPDVIRSTIPGDAYSDEVTEDLIANYKNANWKLEPLLDDYNFWIDDFLETPDYDTLSKEKSVELFDVVDEGSGTKFTVSLEFIHADIINDANHYEFKP